MKKNNAQVINDFFKKFPITSKRKPNIIDFDRGREFYNNTFQIYLNNNNIKQFSRNSSLGALFEGKFSRTIRDILKILVSE